MTKLQLVAFFESDLLRGWCEFRDQSHYKKKTKNKATWITLNTFTLLLWLTSALNPT